MNMPGAQPNGLHPNEIDVGQLTQGIKCSRI